MVINKLDIAHTRLLPRIFDASKTTVVGSKKPFLLGLNYLLLENKDR